MPSVDTSVLVRWLLADVPAHAQRVDALLASGEQFIVDDAAMIEMVFVLQRVMRLSRSLVADAIRSVISTAAFELDRPRWSELATDYLAHPKLSVADLYIARRAAERGALPLYTFDAKLASQIDHAAMP